MRKPLAELDGRDFDVVIIGAGMNGASAAQHLTAAGYSVLLVDKGDFASGSSGRSGRMLHCGLRYLAPGSSMMEFVLHPGKLRTAARMAQQGMIARSEFVGTNPDRVSPYICTFPIYRDNGYRPWQVALAFAALKALGPKDVPLDYSWHKPSEIGKMPLARWLRDQDKLVGLANYREYQFDWPERICVDLALDAEAKGAAVRNYTRVTGLTRKGDGWSVDLADAHEPQETARVEARRVLNMAGIWIDEVNAAADGAKPGRLIRGTKGVHIMVRLPPECRASSVYTFNRLKEGFVCIPFRGMHAIGPTETHYEGNVDDIRPLEEEIQFLIDETNWVFPSLGLKREHVLFSWAGVRPLGNDPAYPEGKRSREIHDLAAMGMPGVHAMTAGPIMTHRSAGIELTRLIARDLQPSRPASAPSYASRKFPENQNSEPLLDDYTGIKLSDLKFAAQHEHPTSLADLLFRRVGAGWTPTMGAHAVERAAAAVADEMGWSAEDVERHVAEYKDYLAREHMVTGRPLAPVVTPAHG